METSAVFLMHDGAVGGGKPGIGRTQFLDFAALDLVRVTTGPNRVREGIAVAEIGSSDMIDRIEAFAELVRDFKAGDPRSDTRNRIVDEIPSFPLLDGDEYSGSKAGQSGGAVDYITYHGDVVRTLREARQACAADDETVGRHRLIDLLVIKGGRLAEVYEIKTSLDRQCLYTAIGQLMTHSISGGELAKRILVVPDGPSFPSDIDYCLRENGITTQRFTISGSQRKTVKLLAEVS